MKDKKDIARRLGVIKKKKKVRTLSQAGQMAAIKKSTNNAGEGVEKREPSYTVDGNAN